MRVSRVSGIRPVSALVLAVAALSVTFVRDSRPQASPPRPVVVRSLAADLPAAVSLGPFRLEGAWRLSGTSKMFGGYSALLPRADGHLLALSDRGTWLDLVGPSVGSAPAPAMGHILRDTAIRDTMYDAEAVTTDPSGQVWVSWEDHQAISRFDRAPGIGWPFERRSFPRAIARWSAQFGAESMARLPDGRFVLVDEDFVARSYQRRHLTLVFPADPTAQPRVEPMAGQLEADEGYRPTDMALLPDGRVLVLLRQLIWPMPLRFSCRIAIADPAQLDRTGNWTAHTLAKLDPPLPTDNYEGLALRPRADGKLDVWVISDDNQASTQQTLLLKLLLDPHKLSLVGR